MITINQLRTDEMAADMLAKSLQGSKFLKFRQLCLNHKIFNCDTTPR